MEIEGRNNCNRKIGSGRNPILDNDIENKIFTWFLDVRSEGIPITDELIKNKCKLLKEEYGDQINCEFSNGWINRFKKRFHIKQPDLFRANISGGKKFWQWQQPRTCGMGDL